MPKLTKLLTVFLIGVSSLFGMSCDETNSNGGNEDMATNWVLGNITATINSGSNAPFGYTIPDTSQANASKLTVIATYADDNDQAITTTRTYVDYGLVTSTFPSGSIFNVKYISNGSEVNYLESATTRQLKIYLSSINFYEGEDHFYSVGTSNFTLSGAVVYQNGLLSVSVNSNYTSSLPLQAKVGDNTADCLVTQTNTSDLFAVGLDFTWSSGTYYNDDVTNKGISLWNGFIYGNGYSFYPSTSWVFDDIGSQTLQVTFNISSTNHVSVDISVNVYSEVQSTSIEKQPTKFIYNHGDSLDFSGITVRLQYGYYSWKDFTFASNTELANAGFKAYYYADKDNPSKTEATTAIYGKGFIYLYYQNPSLSSNIIEISSNFIDIVVNRSLSSIVEKNPASDLSFREGEAFTNSGLEVYARYSDAPTTNIEVSGFTTSPANGYVFTNADYLAGTKTITVSYSENGVEKTYTYTVTVLEAIKLSSISVVTNPSKTTYRVGEIFNTSGLTIKAIYSDSSERVVNSYSTFPSMGYEFSTLNIGVNSFVVTVYYSENGTTVSTTYNLTVIAGYKLDSISVKTNPTKTVYKVGEALDTTGLVITSTYKDGELKTITSDITSGFTLIPDDGYVFTASDMESGSKSINVALLEVSSGVTKTTSFAVSISSTIGTATTIQSIVNYVDAYGELEELDIRFITPSLLSDGTPYVNFPYLTEAFWNATTGLKAEVLESGYKKSGFEVPKFTYMLQFVDSNGIVFGQNFLSRFNLSTGSSGIANYIKEPRITYAWAISTSKINNNNAYDLTVPSKTNYYTGFYTFAKYNNKCTIAVSGDTMTINFYQNAISHDDIAYSTLNNSTQLLGKNIAIFAVQYGKLNSPSITVSEEAPIIQSKFLFAINNVQVSTTTSLALKLNGWKKY